MKLLENDSWLSPYAKVIRERCRYVASKKEALISESADLSSFASSHDYYGIHRTADAWILREWMPNATELFLVGDFSSWKATSAFQFSSTKHGDWELKVPVKTLNHGDLYKLKVRWDGGEGERIPAYARRTIQNEQTRRFSAQVWAPETPYLWKHHCPDLEGRDPIIYEAHVGMATEEPRVGSFSEFQENVLPRLVKGGYNTLQLMAIQEHPYYGSFGYHVSSLFAVSSRFGTPDELKALVDEAHANGIAVIMDIVHSHAVKNRLEGLGLYAGDPGQFFHTDERREHSTWDSLCYDYGNDRVQQMLLSNIQFWMQEYNFDGFRFDGVTSMLFWDHGIAREFTSYKAYFDGEQDLDAIAYLSLANSLIQQIRPGSFSIAEEMSGYPGIAVPVSDGGLGFTHRMAMGVPDYWIRIIKEQRDEEWNMEELFHELTNRRKEEKAISYAESHDQAIVGDKTILFRLVDQEMYWHMSKSSMNLVIDRGIALHKMIRLITCGTASGGYLTFMGNEFGHPDWIDFPREGNDWSHQYARRQWSLSSNKALRYHLLGDFDAAMLKLAESSQLMRRSCNAIKIDNSNNVIAFSRGVLLMVFNFHPTDSYTGYELAVEPGKYKPILSTDEGRFGGFDREDMTFIHESVVERSFGMKHKLQLYLPARSATIYENQSTPKDGEMF